MFNMGANNSISVNRGDTFSIPLFINVGSEHDPEQYDFPGDGEIYLGLMEPNQLFEDAILKKKYDSSNINEEGNIVIEFNSDDTVKLLPGLYYYQIKAKLPLQDNTFAVNTVVPKTPFYILE